MLGWCDNDNDIESREGHTMQYFKLSLIFSSLLLAPLFHSSYSLLFPILTSRTAGTLHPPPRGTGRDRHRGTRRARRSCRRKFQFRPGWTLTQARSEYPRSRRRSLGPAWWKAECTNLPCETSRLPKNRWIGEMRVKRGEERW